MWQRYHVEGSGVFLDVCRYKIKRINCMKLAVIGSAGTEFGRPR